MRRPSFRSTTPAPHSFRAARLVAAVTLAAGVATACSSSGPVAAPESSSTADTSGPVVSIETTASTTSRSETTGSGASSAETLVATVPPNLPEDLVGEVGEVEVIGEPLPKLGRVALEADPARGVQAPILVGTDFDGTTIRIDPTETGRPTLIFFLAHWCSHCNAEVPIINDLRDANAFRPDLDIYGVSSAANASKPNFPPSQWVKDRDWTYPTIVDGVVGEGKEQYFPALRAFGDGGFPMAVLINADGTVAARWTGEVPGDAVLANIEKYLAY